MRKSLFDVETGLVVNVIQLDPDVEFLPPDGMGLGPDAEIGDLIINGERVSQEVPPPPIPTPSLAEQLDAVFSQQSVDLQAQFSPLRAAIKLELDQGRYAIAKRVIELATVPPELETQRQALLALFPEG